MQKAAQINDAYQVLKHPISRAEYLLSEQGVDIRGEQQTLQDPMFLMEQMELREELEEICDKEDADERLFEFEAKVSKMFKQHISTVESQLDQALWVEAADTIRKLKFVDKLKNEIEQAEERMLG